MAVGPLGAILVGLIANVLFLLSLYTPAAVSYTHLTPVDLFPAYAGVILHTGFAE